MEAKLDCRVDSETGVLRDVLLCRPDFYQWLPLNAVARQTLARREHLDLQAVQRQFGELEAALDQAGVQRHYLEPDPHLAYQVYTRDSSVVTPWGAVAMQLHRPQRRGEIASVVRFYQASAGGIWRWATAASVEGGDVHIIRPGLLLIGHSGERTQEAGARQFGDWFAEQGWVVRLQPFAEHFLHLDVVFCMAADGVAVACTEVLDDDLIAWLRHQRIELIPVSYKDAMQLGCNLLALGRNRVISPRHNTALNERLRGHGITVLDPDLGLITKGGGGPHCLTMPLRRDSLAR